MAPNIPDTGRFPMSVHRRAASSMFAFVAGPRTGQRSLSFSGSARSSLKSLSQMTLKHAYGPKYIGLHIVFKALTGRILNDRS